MWKSGKFGLRDNKKSMLRAFARSRAKNEFKMFGVQKWPFWVQNFEVSLHKITNFRDISGSQWTMPSGLFAQKNHTKFFCSC